jgi:catechol 1,2-dioxygenase
MTIDLVQSARINELLDRVSGADQPGGIPRVKKVVRQIVAALYEIIEEFDVTQEEFWRAVAFLQKAAPEFGLIAPGLGFDHFFDIRMDAEDASQGRIGGTPRTIEGPLYVPGAPLSYGQAKLDDGSETGETLIVQGVVMDQHRKPLPGAIVDVWQANTRGAYSHFDPTQILYNNRRRIEADQNGHYRVLGLVPVGYGVPPGGATDRLLAAVGRHGKRPAHIHFFVSAPGHRHLTTQINIANDPYLHDDFAFATREALIPTIVRQQESAACKREGLPGPFSEIAFDFVLLKAQTASECELAPRPRASPK